MASTIEVLRHFSVPIYSWIVPDFAAHREPLLASLRGLREASPGIALTNRNSWHSEQDLHRRADDELIWAFTNIREFARGALGEFYGGFRDVEPRVMEGWGVIGGRGAWHTPHQHYPRPWSGVFYVSAESCISKDPSDRSGKIEFLNPVAASHAFFSAPSIAYDPRDHLVLLFPGALSHLVHPNTTD